jgi:exosome complex component RRP4
LHLFINAQAEVQNFFADGAMSLHTRSLKYGKLENGQLVRVPPMLVKRLKKHHVVLPCGVEVVVGCNGFVWITEHDAEATNVDDGGAGGGAAHRRIFTAEETEAARRRHAAKLISPEARLRVSRVANAIEVLRRGRRVVDPDNIMAVYMASSQRDWAPKVMLQQDHVDALLEALGLAEKRMEEDGHDTGTGMDVHP